MRYRGPGPGAWQDEGGPPDVPAVISGAWLRRQVASTPTPLPAHPSGLLPLRRAGHGARPLAAVPARAGDRGSQGPRRRRVPAPALHPLPQPGDGEEPARRLGAEGFAPPTDRASSGRDQKMRLTCPQCGASFEPDAPNQRFCPPTAEDRAAGRSRSRCAERWNANAWRTRNPKHPRPTWRCTCEVCGESFEATAPDARFCSTGQGSCLAASRATWPEKVLAAFLEPPTHRQVVAYRRSFLLDPCAYCGAPSTQLDHITPRSRGGDDAWDNRAGTCASCNGRKQDVPLLVWMAWRLAFASFEPWNDLRRSLLTR